MYLFNLLADDAAPKTEPWVTWVVLGLFALLLIGMSFFSNRQRKKQAEEDKKKKDSLCAGTTVITIGGIMGVVKSVDHEESSFIMQSGSSELKFDKRAIYQMTLPEGKKKAQANENSEK